jgi:hypothetical protein
MSDRLKLLLMRGIRIAMALGKIEAKFENDVGFRYFRGAHQQ